MSITLTAGMRQNLSTLKTTTDLMELTQSRLSSGKKVQTALDDPLSFFTAREHNQRASDLSFRKDAMGEAIQTIKAANNGIEAIQDLMDAAKATAQSALSAETTTEVQTLGTQYSNLMIQIDKLAEDSGYKGINFLDNDSLTVDFNASGTNDVGVQGFSSDFATLGIDNTTTAWTTGSGSSATVVDTAIQTSLDSFKVATDELRTQSKGLSNNLSIISARQSFTDNMINTLQDGASSLVNADMNEEAANMLMLQTRQALGTTSLSMASQAAQAVLRLF